MRLEIDNATVGYDGRPVLSGATLALEQGEIGCLLGPSGAGKTTLLRAVAGVEPLMGGRIHANGDVLADDRTHLPPERRRIGMVFQDH
ncbi:ATP-binding cassette domain-containing protein, partial [Bacillus tequilensis]|nr:ATP-binding cassette domain-containing protein [Bacillus tequilensis]